MCMCLIPFLTEKPSAWWLYKSEAISYLSFEQVLRLHDRPDYRLTDDSAGRPESPHTRPESSSRPESRAPLSITRFFLPQPISTRLFAGYTLARSTTQAGVLALTTALLHMLKESGSHLRLVLEVRSARYIVNYGTNK
jgi:hypothetical protein